MNRSILFSVLSASALTALSAAQEVEVQFFCDDIVRIVKIPEGGKKPRTSFVVTAKPESVDVRTEESVMGKTYASAKLRVTVGPDGCIAFAKADGSPLLAEEPTVFTPRAMLEGHRGAMAPLESAAQQEVHRSAMDYTVSAGHRGAMAPLGKWGKYRRSIAPRWTMLCRQAIAER